MKKVLILMGSESDMPIMNEAKEILNSLGIENEVKVASAHRTPDRASEFAKNANNKGFAVIIAGAGYAAHLAGAIAANTVLPVIGVPLEGSSLNGFDSLLSTVQMPAGIPVATVTIGKAGAKNAAWLAAEIIATSDDNLRKKLLNIRDEMKKKVEALDKK